MLPLEKVQNLIDRHVKLEKELSSVEIDKKKFASISKEYSDLNDIIKQAKEYLSYQKVGFFQVCLHLNLSYR